MKEFPSMYPFVFWRENIECESDMCLVEEPF